MRTVTVTCEHCESELELMGDEETIQHGWVVLQRTHPLDDTEVEEVDLCSTECVERWAALLSVV